MVASELGKIIEATGRMPSSPILHEMKRSDLSSQISKRGGFEEWAKRMGVSRAHSDSDTGWDGEIAFMKRLSENGFSPERTKSIKSPYDICVNGIVRIDVKAANYAEYGVCKGWFYRIGKDAQADILALYQLDTESVYMLPWNICPKSNILPC